MTVPIALLSTAVAQELLATLLFGVAFALRPKDREHGWAGLFGLAAAAHAGFGAAGADDAARVALLTVAPLLVQHAFTCAPRMPPRRVLAFLYGCFCACAALSLIACTASGGRRWVTIVVLAHATGATAFALGTLGRVARIRREVVLVALGEGLLLLALLNDAAADFGLLPTPRLVDAGLLACVYGMALTRSVRAGSLRDELHARVTELDRLTRETGRIYDQLAAAQEELLQKEQLAVVGELAAVIAHEVRNPLAIIANAVSGLRKEAISREDHETLLAILDEETRRLNRLVTDLLRYARPVNVQRTHFYLTDVLDRAVNHARSAGRGIEAKLNVECKEERIWGDANLLRQVFDNLVDNAVQAMGAGGNLTVRVRSETREGVDGLAVDIIDTGEGMDTIVRSRARDPFFTTRPSGTGLGLAIVDRIVEAHDGYFSIDSHTGEGTTVTVFLPLGSASEPPPKRAAVEVQETKAGQLSPPS